ncbi:MAG: hypothetical protein F4145_19120, partial [Boseongicola sp. SB0675_bin_26]|nr:hypothetical protein [Boseongicola sp. SB0675_bin_26]
MKLVTYNIRYAFGLDGQYDYDRITQAVDGADVVALQEVERHWRRSDMADQVALIEERLPQYHSCYCPAFDVDASETAPDGHVIKRRRQFGTMILSRWPIREARTHILPKIATKQNFNMDTGALECVIATDCGLIRVFSIHLSAISIRERLLQIDYLLDVHRNARARGGSWTGEGPAQNESEWQEFLRHDWNNGEPVPDVADKTVWMGDFNSVPEGPEYRRIVGEFDPTVGGRLLHADGLADSWHLAPPDDKDDPGHTWWPDPPDRAPGRPLRLDYCFLSPELAPHVTRKWVDAEAKGSDHPMAFLLTAGSDRTLFGTP